MPRFVSTLLFGLLGLPACSPKDPTPTVTLDGTWHKRYQESNEYNVDGSMRSQSGLLPDPNKITYVFTSSQLTIKEPVAVYSYDYVRQGQIVTLFPHSMVFSIPFDQTIVELTSTTLILQDERSTTQGGNTITRFHLVR